MPRPPITNPWALWAIDTVERVVRTFLQGFLAALAFDATGGSIPTEDKFVFAGFAGLIALAFAVVGGFTGSHQSASFLPKNVDPPQP